MSTRKKIVIFLLVMLALTPFGLISEYPAWGEWGVEEFQTMVGYIPKGMPNAGIEAPIPDYEVGGMSPVLSTLISATIGIIVSFGFFFALKNIKIKNK